MQREKKMHTQADRQTHTHIHTHAEVSQPCLPVLGQTGGKMLYFLSKLKCQLILMWKWRLSGPQHADTQTAFMLAHAATKPASRASSGHLLSADGVVHTRVTEGCARLRMFAWKALIRPSVTCLPACHMKVISEWRCNCGVLYYKKGTNVPVPCVQVCPCVCVLHFLCVYVLPYLNHIFFFLSQVLLLIVFVHACARNVRLWPIISVLFVLLYLVGVNGNTGGGREGIILLYLFLQPTGTLLSPLAGKRAHINKPTQTHYPTNHEIVMSDLLIPLDSTNCIPSWSRSLHRDTHINRINRELSVSLWQECSTQ